VLNVAILLYDRLTALDAMGPYEVLSRLRDARVTFVAEQPGPVTTDTGMLSLVAEKSLAEFGAVPVSDRVVIDGKYVTGAGVSAGIDMALTLAGRIGGQDAAQAIQLMLEYAPEPPYHAGSPRTAPADLVARLRIGSRHTTASQVAG
jgi:putative intracellular protease/amidase